jgi:hypothetical protein
LPLVIDAGYNAAMRIQFYDDPIRGLRPREEVRFNQLGLFVYEDEKRVALGFDITPFSERPSIQVIVKDIEGEEAANLTVIEALQPNFNITIHLRNESPNGVYHLEAILYYIEEDGNRQVVDSTKKSFDATQPGEQ